MLSRRRRPLGLAGFVLVVLAACGVATPSPTPAPTPTAVATIPAVPSAPPTPAPTPSEAASPAPAPTAAPSTAPTAGSWQPIAEHDALRDNPVQDVTWTGTRFVGLGWDRFLDSPDGLTWHAQDRAVKNGRLEVVASGPGGVVASGAVGEDPASWWSADGLAWKVRRDAFPGRAGRGNSIMITDLVATEDGWLAVGREDPFCMFTCVADPVRALVWRSSDGLRWTRVPDQKALRNGAMNAIARTGSGFIAAGAIGGRAAIWSSTDGSRWTRTPNDPTFRPHGDHEFQQTEVGGVAVGDGVIVAVGMDFGAQDTDSGDGGRAWWSTDGRTWTEASVDLRLDHQMGRVIATPTGFLATGPGGGPPDGTACMGGIWVSADGRAWTCSAPDPAFDGFYPSAAAASESREIALGSMGAGWDGEEEGDPWGAGWWRPVP